MKLLIIQPGRWGDILICLPIAKYYNALGYDIYWPIHQTYLPIFANINYVMPLLMKNIREGAANEIYRHMAVTSYDKIIDLSIGYDGHVDGWWNAHKNEYDSFVTAKYSLAQVPLKERWNLDWIRNIKKEESLYKALVAHEPYDLIHNSTHIGKLFDHHEKSNAIYFIPEQGYNIFDWYKIIINANEIHCIDSLLANFVEVINETRNIRKHIYLSVRNTDDTEVNSIYENLWNKL